MFASRRYILTIAALLTLAGAPAVAGPDCTCRHKGGDVLEGQMACIKTQGGTMLARCEKVLNNMSWKLLNRPCPAAGLQSPRRDKEIRLAIRITAADQPHLL